MRFHSRLSLFCLILSAACSISSAQSVSQPRQYAELSWKTISDESYAATFRYGWENARLRSEGGSEIPVELDPELEGYDVGEFLFTSRAIDVPASGGSILFDRIIGLHPSDKERGTKLEIPSGKEECAAVKRMLFMQCIDIIDAATGEVLRPRVDWRHIATSRLSILEDRNINDELALDLSPIAGRTVRIRARVITAYSGRDCSNVRATASVTEATFHTLISPDAECDTSGERIEQDLR
jgi:hypothetical protein